MLPTEDAAWVGEELARRFGLPLWQFALTATDANRFALRLAREVTGRPKVLVFDWCYHGSVDEALATLDTGRASSGRARQRRPAGRPGADDEGRPVQRPRSARAGAGARRRRLRARRAGADEHRDRPPRGRLPRGAAGADSRDRDAARDRRDAHAERRARRLHARVGARAGHRHGRQGDRRRDARGGLRRHAPSSRSASRAAPRPTTRTSGGIGGTLAGNALSLAATRATLEHVLTDEAYERTIPLAARFAADVARRSTASALPWHVTAARMPRGVPIPAEPPRDGAEAARRDRRRARAVHARLRPEPRRAPDAVPQHGADVPGDERRGRRRRTPRRSPGLSRS